MFTGVSRLAQCPEVPFSEGGFLPLLLHLHLITSLWPACVSGWLSACPLGQNAVGLRARCPLEAGRALPLLVSPDARLGPCSTCLLLPALPPNRDQGKGLGRVGPGPAQL